MTVKELIEKLADMPQDLPVFDVGHFAIEGCHIDEEFYNGDPANPNCPIITAVVID